MQIPKELIEKAKETLGDRNFRIICENYGVPEGNRDDRAMKCNCVFHEGDHTPSLVYNRRDHYMHCFACQKTVDILDSYMYTGMTYIEACKKLFAEAEIQFAFGEHRVPTYHNYRYPVVPPKENDRTKVISYWKTREISEKTLDYCDIRADEYGNTAFIVYDLNDVPTVVKYKPTDIPRNPDKPKCWFQKNADKKDILFNMNRANTSEPLLICEGECLPGDTEVLTNNGWIQLQNYNNELVLQINDDLSSSFVKPIAYINKHYDGEMVQYATGGNYSLTTTLNHNWVYVDYRGRLLKRPGSEMPKSIGAGYLPVCAKHDGNGLPYRDNEIALWLAISADGHIDERKTVDYNYCRISLKKKRKIARLQWLLDSLGYEYVKTKENNDEEYAFFGIKIPKYIAKVLPMSLATETTLKQKTLILEELIHWDGNLVPNREQFEYSSVIYDNAKVIQTIAHLCGYMSTILERSNNFGKWYKVSILCKKRGVSFQKGFSNKYHYDGQVYCVTVPSGMIMVRQGGHIAITGNCDVLAAIEAGYTNAVSPLNGATSFGWVSECWDFLDQFQEIIVAGDHDEAGNKMNQELVFRLGSWRTKIADIPEEYTNPITEKTYHIKDINEYLYWAGKRAVYEAIVNAKDTPVKSVIDISEVQDIDIDQMDGIETGFREIDKELYKIFYSTVTLISGRPGAGKSSLTNAIIANAMEQDIPCFLFSKEMPERIVKNWLVSQIAGSGHIYERISQNGNVYYNVDPQSKLKIDAWMKNKLYLYRDNEPNDVDSLVTSMTDCVRKFGTRLMVIDNLMCIDLGGASDKLESQKQFIVKLVDFSIKMGVAVILVAHPRKRQPGESAEADVSLDDIAGSSDLTNMCHRSISLRRIGKKEHEEGKSEFSKYNVKLVCTKDRILGKADVEFGLYYDVPSRRFFSSYEEYARAYSWDDKASELNLPIPRCLLDERYSDADEEVFGSVS